jgi:hypothetical protein
MQHIDVIESSRLQVQKHLDSSKTQAERNKLGQFATPGALAIDILILYQITRSLPPPHAGCPRRNPGRLRVLTRLWTLDVGLWTRRATRSLRLPVLTNQSVVRAPDLI